MEPNKGIHPTYSRYFKRQIDFNQKNIAKYVEEVIKDVEKDKKRRKIVDDYGNRFKQLLDN